MSNLTPANRFPSDSKASTLRGLGNACYNGGAYATYSMWYGEARDTEIAPIPAYRGHLHVEPRDFDKAGEIKCPISLTICFHGRYSNPMAM